MSGINEAESLNGEITQMSYLHLVEDMEGYMNLAKGLDLLIS